MAARLGVNIQDLPGKIGIGRASLFSYRTGKRSITSKTWAKLEAAERAAGIDSGASGAEIPAGGLVVRSAEPKYFAEGAGKKPEGGGDHFRGAGNMVWERVAADRAETIRTLLGVVADQAATIRALTGRETQDCKTQDAREQLARRGAGGRDATDNAGRVENGGGL